MKIVIGITGASGSIYAVRLLKALEGSKHEIHLITSETAGRIAKYEGQDKNLEGLLGSGRIKQYDEKELWSSIASGSFKVDAMVVIPCSMKTLAAIAAGYSSNLITRCADVAIKEGKKLVLVPRETPLSAIHLENMLKLSRLRVVILPAMPGFYHGPKNLEDLGDFIAGKVMDSLGMANELYKRWEGEESK